MYDLAIIGAGWAGFNAAKKARELKLKACLIERSQIGGTCLNTGCIPTKTLIRSARVYSLAMKASNFCIDIQNPSCNFSKIQQRKEMIIQGLRSGMQSMLSGIDFLSGQALITGKNEIQLGAKTLNAKYILLASGSRPYELPFLKFDGKKVISSNEALDLKEIPKSMLIVGGGAIGSEFASFFNYLGTSVTLVEKFPQLLPGIDKETAKKIETAFKKRGIKVSTGMDASDLNPADFDLILVSVGRQPDTEGLGLEKLGIKLDKGRIAVDDYLRTNIENIYAAGDCAAKIMLAHYAAYQGVIAAENMADPSRMKKADNNVVPACFFTDPDIGVVGINEEEAAAKNIQVKVKRIDFLSSGMARIINETDGFIKIISDAKSDEIIGASIIGPEATELIACIGVAMSNHIKTQQLKETIFAHPTLSESIHEAL